MNDSRPRKLPILPRSRPRRRPSCRKKSDLLQDGYKARFISGLFCENALAHRLRNAGLNVKQQYPLKVYDEDGTLIGDYAADLLVEGVLIVKLKTAKTEDFLFPQFAAFNS